MLKMSNSTYDFWKWMTQIFIPALGTFYGVLGGLWDFPKTEIVVSTILAVDTFLGVILGMASAQYSNMKRNEPEAGLIAVNTKDLNAEPITVRFKEHPMDMKHGATVKFKVVSDVSEDD